LSVFDMHIPDSHAQSLVALINHAVAVRKLLPNQIGQRALDDLSRGVMGIASTATNRSGHLSFATP
jgi:hypothetical protein